MTTASLFDAYQALPRNQQAIVEICSLAYRFQTVTDLLKCLGEAGVRSENNAKFNHALLKPVLESLAKKKILLFDKQVNCNPLLSEKVMRHVYRQPHFKKYLLVVQQIHPLEARNDKFYGYYGMRLDQQNVPREMRLAVYRGDVETYNQLLRFALEWNIVYLPANFLARVCSNPFDPQWFGSLEIGFREAAIAQILQDVVSHSLPFDEYLAYFTGIDPQKLPEQSGDFLLQLHLLRGDLSSAAMLLKDATPPIFATTAKAMIALLQGKVAVALDEFRSALRIYRKASGRRNDFLHHFNSVFYLLALLEGDQPERLAELKKILGTKSKNLHQITWRSQQIMGAALQSLQGQLKTVPQELVLRGIDKGGNTLLELLQSLVLLWFFQDQLKQQQQLVEAYFRRAMKAGHLWLAMEFAVILSESGCTDTAVCQAAEQLPASLKLKPLAFLRPQLSPWERCLNALKTLEPGQTQAAARVSEERLVYLVSYYADRGIFLNPMLQKRLASGKWSKGKDVSLQRLRDGELSCMSEQDHDIAKAIVRAPNYYGSDRYVLDRVKAVLAATGHPQLFLEDAPWQAVEMIRDTPTIIVTNNPDGFAVSLSIEPDPSGITIVQEASDRFRIYEFTSQQLQAAAILGKQGVLVPAGGEEKLQQTLSALSGLMTVYSALESGHESIETVDADGTIHGHLVPAATGYRLDLLVKPVGEAGPYLQPGLGSPHILATVDNRRIQAKRDLEAEQQQLQQILAVCPTLRMLDDGSLSWALFDLESCLNVLLELRDTSDLLSLEWPEGKELKVQSRLEYDKMAIRIEQQQDWFALSGEIKLDENRVLQMHELLALLEQSPGLFVKISDGEYLALTDQLKRRLEDLNAYSQRKGKRIDIHPTAAFAISDFVDSVGSARVDEGWISLLERLKSADGMEFTPPSTLQTGLRDYQLTGYKWLARLAYLQLGACLADDMGLGKTIQALAILLNRATAGPALVVAPASVTFNWANEIRRFAPTLNVRQFSQNDRDKLVADLATFDVLVCSYGLLQSEEDLLTAVDWGTIVLDEAQAIKNEATKRSKAAMQLRGGFKLLTTGTPLENHLGELWNLFNFINPGLLGSLNAFNAKYAAPITRYNDKKARARLRQLLQPFILRRLKSEVLDELPPKTEITLTVDLSAEEAAFYEALRRKAIQNLSEIDSEAADGRFKVFAELMRLRRACCHTRLVLPESLISSTKLTLFLELVKELLANRHKALVFSQFVDHLKIIAAALDQEQISYQYLDGATTMAQRKQRVEAFQAGEGDLFLISLRAGGTGLNLTAADYVIHMDPWWNPAVEDQASDRAHRIGQERPVTVYRFVTSHTIEEKIIDLHTRKRDLANTLLEGTDSPGRISVAELLELLKDGQAV